MNGCHQNARPKNGQNQSIIHNKTSSIGKTPSPVVLSHQYPLTYFRTVCTCKWCLICAHFSPGQTRWLFTINRGFILVESNSDECLNDQFVYYKQTTFHTQSEIIDCLWIIEMFLSTVWTLFLTAPIHCRGSIDEQVMQCKISPNLFSLTSRMA